MNRNTLHSIASTSYDRLHTLVENRTAHSYESCELNLFETHQAAENVYLKFNDFVLTSMISGKKVMNLKNKVSFDYFPGESVILPPNEMMQIDFPEATLDNPTQCLALTISPELISNTIEQLNESNPKADSWGKWHVDTNMFHLSNSSELSDTLNRIISVTKNESGKGKNLIVEYTIREMLIRLMQTQAKSLLQSCYRDLESSNSLAAVVSHIKQNLSSKIDIQSLSDMACMSRASFFKKFKESIGETPSQFIIKERIKAAKHLLKDNNLSVTQVCYESGFENLSHFIKSFKQEVGMTPKSFQNGE